MSDKLKIAVDALKEIVAHRWSYWPPRKGELHCFHCGKRIWLSAVGGEEKHYEGCPFPIALRALEALSEEAPVDLERRLADIRSITEHESKLSRRWVVEYTNGHILDTSSAILAQEELVRFQWTTIKNLTKTSRIFYK